MSELPQKRGPGRPPSDRRHTKIERKGIQQTPEFPDNDIEFYSAQPGVFKKLFNLYKATNVPDIIISFELDKITFSANSYSEQNNYLTTIDCTRAHRYYCRQPVRLQLGREGAEGVINRIDPKFFDSIRFIVKKFTLEVNNMIIMLSNPSLGAKSTHTLNLTSHTTNNNDNFNSLGNNSLSVDNFDESNYALSFKFKRQEFKKYISDIDTITSRLVIEKIEGYPLKFKYANKSNVVSCVEVFEKDSEIDLKCDQSKKIIATTVSIADIKPLSNAQIADSVTIYVDNKKKILFLFNMDDAIVTRVLVAVDDYTSNNL